MKVRELIELLSQFDRELIVHIAWWDADGDTDKFFTPIDLDSDDGETLMVVVDGI